MIRMCGRSLDPEDMDVKVGSNLIAHTDTVPEQIKKGEHLKGEHSHMQDLGTKAFVSCPFSKTGMSHLLFMRA